MLRISALGLVAGLMLLGIAAAEAAVTPAIRTTAGNQVPACVTPDRLMDFMRSRNKKLQPKYNDIAKYYKQHGEALGVRWDYAFYQMILETNSLKFHRPNGRPGDVSHKQNNFAGIGATGRRARGESFRDVSTGVLAHLHHVRLYSGDPVAKPAAGRTEKVKDLILPWAQGFGRPVTFTDLATKWALKNKHYAPGLNAIADAYNERFCPEGDTVQQTVETTASIDAPATASTAKTSNKANKKKVAAAGSDMIKATVTASTDSSADVASATTKVAALTTAVPTLPAPAACKVFTASYGGAKSLLIQSTKDGHTHFTALTVHEGKEDVQAQAFINAYAQGGETIAVFQSPDEAITKAFQLCPEK